ncbi:hypothetical protein K440DRAFT_644067 [Wilcoxina mikolae CBS 423.85]|nr:hypothetical protein K440DRAFT_644067 [Wilcoxina mikolae CBS 423.85]
MDIIPALESLCEGFFPDRHFNSIQEEVEIAEREMTPQDQSKFMHGVYGLFTDIHEVSNGKVAWLSEFEENNAGWRELGYKRYYDYLRTIDSYGLVREMVKQHNTAQKNMDCATKKLGDYWQQCAKLLEILNDGDGNPELAKGCLNYAVFSRIIKLGRTFKVNSWYMYADFKEAKAILEKLYRELVMPVAYDPCKEDQSCTRALSPSALPRNRQIPSALPALISSALPTEKDSSPDIPHIPDTILDDVTQVVFNVTEVVDNVADVIDDVTEVLDNLAEVIDDVTEVVDEDDEATSSYNKSSDNESSETAVTPTPVRTKASRKRKRARRPLTLNPTSDKPIDGYDEVVICSDNMERKVRYAQLVGEEERMITYHHGIYGKHALLIVQRAIHQKPNVFQTARDQIVSGLIDMQNMIIRTE